MLLPKNNPAEDLETISRNKFSMLFAPSLFEVRSELQRDKGIDLTIELKQDNCYTNFRFPVQLKSTISAETNKDLSMSFPVDVSNINYLLNYGMPGYYILYDHRVGVFYFEQVHAVLRSLIEKYHRPEKFPEQFSIRFSKLLTLDAIKEIYDEILKSGWLLRRINEHRGLSSAPTKQNSGMIIDDNNEVYSVEHNMAFIERFGLQLMNRCEHTRIIEIEQRTHPRTTVSPMFNLVCGLAYFQQANLYKAVDFLKAAHNESASFEPTVQSTLAYTYLQARQLLGIITEDDFKKETTVLMQAEGIGSHLELEKAYATFLENRETDIERIKALEDKISSLIASEPYNTGLRIRGYSIILTIEGKQLAHNLASNFILLCNRVPDLQQTNIYKRWKAIDDKHSRRLQSLVMYSLHTQYFLSFSNILLEASEWTYQKIYTLYSLKNWSYKSLSVEGKLSGEESTLLSREVERIDSVIGGYELQEHKENIVHALSFKYEILDFARRADEAEATAVQITAMIEKYDMNSLKSRHASMLKGDSRYKRFLDHFTGHMKNIYEVAKNCAMEKHLTIPITGKMLTDYDDPDKEMKWLEGDFFEMHYPLPDEKNNPENIFL